MIYTSTMTLIVPLDQLETAKRVSRALDNDSGGYEAFAARVQKDGVEYAMYSTPVTASLATKAALLLAVPEQLHAVISWDYHTRWPEYECPNMPELEALCGAIQCYIDSEPEGYTVKEPEVECELFSSSVPSLPSLSLVYSGKDNGVLGVLKN